MKTSKLERDIGLALEKECNISLIKQFPIVDKITQKKFVFDFRIRDTNILLEIQGDYWHANPETNQVNTFDKRTKKFASSRWFTDAMKVGAANRNNYKLITIWESEWNTNPITITETIIREVNKGNTACF